MHLNMPMDFLKTSMNIRENNFLCGGVLEVTLLFSLIRTLFFMILCCVHFYFLRYVNNRNRSGKRFQREYGIIKKSDYSILFSPTHFYGVSNIETVHNIPICWKTTLSVIVLKGMSHLKNHRICLMKINV